ncbi:hypothetical protein DB347_19480 [Opitutaceae bacterium EW11]|nr:hypothetical protein DB347_19480 [Opitutaceae bacterium EW11]
MKLLFVGCTLLVLSSVSAVAGTRYLSGLTSLKYNDTDSILMGSGQTVTIDDATGWVTEGRLAPNTTQWAKYGPGRTAIFLQNSMIKFSGGYASDGYLYDMGGVQSLSYGSAHTAAFLERSHINFAGGYVSGGYVSESSSWLPYNSAYGLVHVNSAAKVEFTPGADGTGALAKAVLVSATWLYYGPGRNAQFRASGVFTSFSGGYVSQGVLETTTWLTTRTGVVQVAASTICTFSGGYYTP